MSLSDRIQIRLKKLEKTERAASLEAGLSDSFLRNIRDGKSLSPRIDTLEKIASVLQTTPSWLMFGAGEEDLLSAFNNDEKACTIPAQESMATPNAAVRGGIQSVSRRLPVYGQAVGGVDGEFLMNGSVLFDVLCPPQLSEKNSAYAVLISGDSMYPRYEDGELAFIDPTRRVKKGDYVIAQIMMDAYDACPQAFVKKFVRHNAAELVLEQFNPEKTLKFPHRCVVSVHYVALAGDAS